MTITEGVEIGLAVFGVLATLMGGAWWMSSLYSEVCYIRKDTTEFNTKLTSIHDTLREDLASVKEIQTEHGHDIGDLKVRVSVLETNADTECEAR